MLAGIANDEVRKKWEHVTSKGYTEAELEDSRRKVRTVIEKMEKRLAAMGDWLAGTYSLADIKNYSFAQHVERSVPDALTEAQDAARLRMAAQNGGAAGSEGVQGDGAAAIISWRSRRFDLAHDRKFAQS